MNAAEILLTSGDAAATAIVCGEAQIAYGELRERVAVAAGAWRALGLGAGERVAIYAPDSIEWVVAYLGAIWAGGVAIGINPRLPAAELAPLLAESEARFVWCEGAQAPLLQPALASEAPHIRPVCLDACAGALHWPGLLAEAEAIGPQARDEEDAAFWIGTSGTTGRPKAVIHVQRAVLEADSFAAQLLGVTAADRLYASSKLFFAYALGNSLLAGLRRGATVILDHEWPTPERVEEMVAQHRPTILFSVPTLYQKLLAGGAAARLARSPIRGYVSAGEALPQPLRAAWREATGKAPLSGYGTSETLCLMLYCDDDTGRMRPTPLTEVRYDDSRSVGEPQRIWLKSRTVAAGYWRRPQAQADGFADGRFSPGDLFLCGDGGFEYAGRNDDMLKIAGQWVSTLWVEQTLAAACGDALQQVAAVAVTTRDGLGALAVLAVPTAGAQEPAARRMGAAIDSMAGHRRPRWVHWVDALPLTATGKIQRSGLRALHERAAQGSA